MPTTVDDTATLELYPAASGQTAMAASEGGPFGGLQ